MLALYRRQDDRAHGRPRMDHKRALRRRRAASTPAAWAPLRPIPYYTPAVAGTVHGDASSCPRCAAMNSRGPRLPRLPVLRPDADPATARRSSNTTAASATRRRRSCCRCWRATCWTIMQATAQRRAGQACTLSLRSPAARRAWCMASRRLSRSNTKRARTSPAWHADGQRSGATVYHAGTALRRAATTSPRGGRVLGVDRDGRYALGSALDGAYAAVSQESVLTARTYRNDIWQNAR